MKVNLYAADLGGCGHYRIIWPGEALKVNSTVLDVTITTETDKDKAVIQTTCIDHPETGERIVVDATPPDADVVVLQRPLVRDLVLTIPFLQARGVAVVVEVDDDFHSIHPHNIAWRTSDPAQSPAVNRDWLMRACKMADLVTVSTPVLAERYAPHGRFAVLPNYLPPHAYKAQASAAHMPPDGSRGAVWVGWTGTIATHPDDLQVTHGAVGQALIKTGAGLWVTGPELGVRERLGVPDDTPFHSTGWVPLKDYYGAMAGMDIGIVPLNDSPFNRAKSWLKGLEMAALGIPFIASPLPEYQALANLGIGETVAKPRMWEGILKALIKDKDRREAVAYDAWRASETLSIDQHVWKWEDAYLQARANFAGRRHASEYGMPALLERVVL